MKSDLLNRERFVIQSYRTWRSRYSESLPTYISAEGLGFTGSCGCSVELCLCVTLNAEQNSAEEVLISALSPPE